MFTLQYLFAFCNLAVAICATPQLSIRQPSGNTVDQEVIIQIEQLTPLQIIELEAKSIDEKGETWASHATFQADKQGSIHITDQKPLPNSSYETVDGMGLFWSMLPPSKDLSAIFKPKDDQFIVELTLLQNGKTLKKETITRFLKKSNIQKIKIRENGIVGSLFIPPSSKPLPIIITLSGSNGGLSETRAKLLASNGFAVFALGYFRMEGLPSNLQDIPLEYFESAFKWLKNQPTVDSTRIGLYGISRGGELALILGSIFPDSTQAIVAVVPSSVVYPGLSKHPTNAWTYHGKPIFPYALVPQAADILMIGKDASKPVNTRKNFLDGMLQIEAFEAASIPVEKIRCPTLLISGGDDQLWPSDVFAEKIMERLKKKNSSIICRHICYPSAGHGINVPNLPTPGPVYYHPVIKLWCSVGGSRAADAEANRDSWKKTIEFFHEIFLKK